MARETQTKVVIGAETKGFVKVNQEAAKISKAASAAAKEHLKNTKDVEKELSRMGSQLKELARHQVSLNKEMEKVDKSSDLYKTLAGRLKDVNKQQDDLQRSTRNVERAFRDQGRAVTAAQMASGGFVQGLVQGAVPGAGPFIQRGPGMGRQMIGMAAGRAARGVAGGIARAPFAGLQGIGQALSMMPGGGFVGGPMMLAAQQAGPALAFRAGLQQAMPFLGTGQFRARAAAVGGALTEEEILRRAEAARTAAQRPTRGWERRAGAIAEIEAESQRGEIAFTAEKERLEGLEARRTRRLRGVAKERREAFGAISGPGAALAGMAKPEAFQFAAQVARIGGGRAMEMPPAFFQAAFAARTLYQAGPEVTGAFMQAGRRGGLVGGVGRGGEAIAETIGQATAIGLEGSEINDFLSVIASGIQDWKRTGIPMNAGSITGIARGVGGAVGAVRGMTIARGITGAAQGLAMGGPQSAIDMMMLQAVGYRGGGAESFEQAQIALERGEFGAKETSRLMERLTTMGGGGAAGRLFAREQLRQKGIQIGPTEMQRIGREGIAELPKAGTLTSKELAERAATELDPALARQANIVNQQIATGNAMLSSTQNMAEAASATAKTFTDTFGPSIDSLTTGIKEAADGLSEFTEKARKSGNTLTYVLKNLITVVPPEEFNTGEGT
jgi:hypothetical protein